MLAISKYCKYLQNLLTISEWILFQMKFYMIFFPSVALLFCGAQAVQCSCICEVFQIIPLQHCIQLGCCLSELHAKFWNWACTVYSICRFFSSLWVGIRKADWPLKTANSSLILIKSKKYALLHTVCNNLLIKMNHTSNFTWPKHWFFSGLCTNNLINMI